MSSNVGAQNSLHPKADPSSEPFIPSYFISDGKAANGYNFQPPKKRQQHVDTMPPKRSQ